MSAEKLSRLRYIGSYEATGQEHQGAAVYRKSDDRYLTRHSDGTWRGSRKLEMKKVGLKLGLGLGSYYWPSIIKSVGTSECPASITEWKYLENIGDWRSEDITVKCSYHT